MTALLTTKFKHSLAKTVLDSVSNTMYYVTVGKTLEFPSDAAPPAPTDSVSSSHYGVYDDMIFGKHMLADDVKIMALRHDWTSGTVYDAYDHDEAKLYDYGYKFYVTVNEGSFFSVFKCLDNNNGAPSTHKPSVYETAADDEFYMTAEDGYQWKYMFTIPKATFEKFASSQYIPIVANSAVVANAVPGAIETIRVVEGGNRYNSYTSGTIQSARVNGNNQLYTIESASSSNTDFYKNSVIKITAGPGAGQQRTIAQYIVSGGVKRVLVSQEFDTINLPTEESTYEISPNVVIVGNGDGFQGRALVNATSNSIYAVEITNRGQGYSWANAVVVGNTGIINSASNTYIQANNAALRVIVSPPGGHGSNPEAELAGTHLGLSLTFNTTESGGKIVANNDFRRVAIVRNPLFANVALGISNNTSIFAVGETLVQANTGATGVVKTSNSTVLTLTNVLGLFETTDSSNTSNIINLLKSSSSNTTAYVASMNPFGDNNNPSLYFDQTYTFAATKTTPTSFIDDEMVYQGDHANGYVYFANSSVMKIANVRGTFNSAETSSSEGMIYGQSSLAAANVTHIKLPDVVHGSGEVLYIENITPVARANGQTETIKVIVEF